VNLSDWESVLKGICNTYRTLTQKLKNKIQRLKSRGEIVQFYWIPEHCGVEFNERAESKAKQSINEGRVANYYYQWQTLKSSGRRKAKWSFTVSLKTPGGTEENGTLEGTTGMSRFRGSARSI
jgi:hypothetical protein